VIGVGYVWAKVAAGGILVRGYGWLGESAKTLWDEGPMTPEEQNLRFAFVDEPRSEAKDDSY
jgi:hypothetical protein